MFGVRQLKQKMLIVFIGLGIIAVTILTTLYVSDVEIFTVFSAEKKGYRNITFTDAVLSCKEKTRVQFNTHMRSLAVDDHSSRYENRSYKYKIFLKMDLYDPKNAKTQMNYINCFVRASNGRVSKYEVLVDNEGQGGATARKSTNLFGFPIK